MEISTFQKLMENLYFERDKKRGLNGTFLWFIEEVGELAEALRHNQISTEKTNYGNLKENIAEELADILAWLCSLANLLDIDLQKAAIKKYPKNCKKCDSNPCLCNKL